MFDRIGSAAQDRVTALNDRERVVFASEGNCSYHAVIPLIGSEHSWCIEPQPTLLDDEATVLDVEQSGVLTDGARPRLMRCRAGARRLSRRRQPLGGRCRLPAVRAGTRPPNRPVRDVG